MSLDQNNIYTYFRVQYEGITITNIKYYVWIKKIRGIIFGKHRFGLGKRD
jgi:hypothetical protein